MVLLAPEVGPRVGINPELELRTVHVLQPLDPVLGCLGAIPGWEGTRGPRSAGDQTTLVCVQGTTFMPLYSMFLLFVLESYQWCSQLTLNSTLRSGDYM